MEKKVEKLELYLKYRPKTFKEVIGQKAAIKPLVEMGKRGVIPHTMLFTGPSGCGKTTLARILKDKLKCGDCDFNEINSSNHRGIEEIRTISKQVKMAPMGGKVRVWIIDECHAMTSDAQNAFLKVLEDTPSHVYFFLATTDPHKLKKTVLTRCTEIRCNKLTDKDLISLVNSVYSQEIDGGKLDEDVVKKIARVAIGSARKALVLLNQILHISDPVDQMASVETCDVEGYAIEIARALMSSKTSWEKMSKILNGVINKEEAESLRWLVLAYSKSVLLGDATQYHGRAALVIEEFREHWFDCKDAGLVVSCWNVICNK